MKPSVRLACTAAARAAALAGLLAFACGSAVAQTSTWEYRSYKKSLSAGQFDKNNFTLGTISIVEKGDGKAAFRFTVGRVDVCYRGELPATVTRTAELTTIEVTQVVPGCEELRYVIRNDGSGGTREARRGDAWVKSPFDHGLTPVK